MNFEKYEREARSHYVAFGETVAAILRAAIGEAGGFRLQQVCSRAKDPASLRKKLEKRGAERGVDLVSADGLEDEIKDLAGCRIVFYTNSDVTKLINSGLIGENFEIVEVKLHHPRREAEEAAELYISNHYLVRLGADRLKLPEYAAFAGLRCEIQVQTILNHAWAEMAHDTIYKEPELDSFGTRALDAIKTRMAKIARRYLVPAGYEFGKVVADFERLIKGETLFKGEALQSIADAPDNNERMLALDTFADSVLPLYDDVRPEFHEILKTLGDAVLKSRATEPKPISTPYGDLPAKTPADVTRRVAKTIGDLRYVDPDASLKTLLDLYAGAATEDERKPLREAGKRLADHELDVWNRHGPVIQTMVVDTLARSTVDQRRDALPLVATVLEAVLGTEVTGTTSTSGTVTFHRGIRYADHPGTLVTSVFIPGLRHMAAHGDESWLGRGFSTWFWVMREAGIELKRAAIRHIDTSFVLTREGDYAGLFTDADLLAELEGTIAARPALVAEARATLSGEEPQREMGDHCSAPFACEFAAYCSRDLPQGPEWPVTVLPYGGGKRWLERGVEDLLDLAEADLNDCHARILAATRDGIPFHDAEGARKAMAGWGWPRAWLDFETVAPAVPRWVGTRPYQQIPFQFSLHLERRGGRMTHHEFLSCDGTDPRRACAEALVEHIPAGATIIAYNAGFERSVLRDLAASFLDLAPRLEAMAEATVDLLPVARNHWYHRDQRGSWSIKAVLPTIAAELDYGALEVKDGGDAQAAWFEAADPACDPMRREALEEALKAYCARDTWAMVAVARALAGS